MKLISFRHFARFFASPIRMIALVVALDSVIACAASWAESAPIVLTGADRRPATSLNGDWGSIVDPYFAGLFSFHHQEKKNGWFLNRKAQPNDPLRPNTTSPLRPS